MTNVHTALKFLVASVFAVSVLMSCANTTNPTGGSSTGIWLESSRQGRITVPMDAADPWFTVTTGNTAQLQFGAAGWNASSALCIASIIFPLGATTGTYTITPTRPTLASTMTAGTAYVEMGTNNQGKSVAQSGSVSLTVTGAKYTIDYTRLPALNDNTTPAGADTLSAHLAN